MAKVIKFPVPAPEKFGPQRVRKKKGTTDKQGQLNLFSAGKVVALNQLTTFEEALIFDERGDDATARSRYLLAIEKVDALADAYCNLGILEFQQGNTTKAIDYFTLSLRHEPRHFEAHYNLANLYAEVGNFPLAKIHYKVSIEIEPSFPNSYFNLGLALAMNKEFAEAIQALNQYRLLTPQSEHAHADELIRTMSLGKS
jgi:tetratricopeptide (TPR) repeat protein